MSLLEELGNWAKLAPTDDFWPVAITLVVLAIGCFIGTFYYLIRKRIIQDIPTSKIRSAAQGYVELAGRSELMQGEQIRAPLTNTTCTWYSYKIEEHRGSGKNSRWVTIEKGTSDALFLLIDDTGQAVIDPEGASVTPAAEDIWYGRTRFPDFTSAKRGGNKWFKLTGKRYCFTEQRIHPGDPLYAIGLFNTTGGDDSASDLNTDVRELLREWKQDSKELLKRFDTNNDNRIDMDEWNKAREAALKQVMARHSEMKKISPVHIMSNTRDGRRPYLLSAVPESNLVKKFATYTKLCITVFFIAGILATWLISIRLYG